MLSVGLVQVHTFCLSMLPVFWGSRYIHRFTLFDDCSESYLTEVCVQQCDWSQHNHHLVFVIFQWDDYEWNLGFDNISNAENLRIHGFHPLQRSVRQVFLYFFGLTFSLNPSSVPDNSALRFPRHARIRILLSQAYWGHHVDPLTEKLGQAAYQVRRVLLLGIGSKLRICYLVPQMSLLMPRIQAIHPVHYDRRVHIFLERWLLRFRMW